MNLQALQIGVKSFINLSSFAARPRSLKTGQLGSLRLRVMSSKRGVSSSTKSAAAASIVDDKKDNKLKGMSGDCSEDVLIEESCWKVQSVEFQSIKDDPAKIEAMTVQELRATLRKFGVPTKGRKGDLVFALKHFMGKKKDGENSQELEERVSINSLKNISLQKNTKRTSDESCIVSIDTVSEVSGFKKSKRRMKQSPVEDEIVNVDTEIATTKRKLSNTEIATTKRKLSIKTDDLITLPQAEPWTVLAHKKPQKGWIPYNPRTIRPAPLTDGNSVKLMSWNVNGLRALLKFEGFSALELAQRENFDVLCLQETKLQDKDVDSVKQCLIDGYENSFWTCSNAKLGYSGTAIISRIKPLSVCYGLGIPDHDSEGRVVTAEFDSFYLVNTYVPNSGDGLKRLSYRTTQWDPSLSNYMKELEKSKPVILTGDLNCAHQEIDIYNPAGNKRSAGFTEEERKSFGSNFLSKGFVDTFRKQHPNAVGYTYWGYRHGGRKNNRGWRLDYFLVSESIADDVHDSYIAPDVNGSDHCPIGLVLKV
ncbi:hypothetical protein OIU76_021381 [Salix suchowensis]|nr:hypothetical protein OIU76_021381 [Salix suchowensis]